MSNAHFATLRSKWKRLKRLVKREKLRDLIDTARESACALEAELAAVVDRWPEAGQVVRSHFYHDVWHGENVTGFDPKVSGMAVLDLEAGNEDTMKQMLSAAGWSEVAVTKTMTKLENIKRAHVHMMQQEPLQLSIDLVMSVHGVLMRGLLDRPGQFRTERRGPAKSFSFSEYAPPSTIRGRLEQLVMFVASKKVERGFVLENLLLMVFFFREFLLIHPFENGNGRSARLLLCLFLPSLSLPLSFDGANRRQYIEVLDQCGPKGVPAQVCSFVIKELGRSLQQLHFILGIEAGDVRAVDAAAEPGPRPSRGGSIVEGKGALEARRVRSATDGNDASAQDEGESLERRLSIAAWEAMQAYASAEAQQGLRELMHRESKAFVLCRPGEGGAGRGKLVFGSRARLGEAVAWEASVADESGAYKEVLVEGGGAGLVALRRVAEASVAGLMRDRASFSRLERAKTREEARKVLGGSSFMARVEEAVDEWAAVEEGFAALEKKERLEKKGMGRGRLLRLAEKDGFPVTRATMSELARARARRSRRMGQKVGKKPLKSAEAVRAEIETKAVEEGRFLLWAQALGEGLRQSAFLLDVAAKSEWPLMALDCRDLVFASPDSGTERHCVGLGVLLRALVPGPEGGVAGRGEPYSRAARARELVLAALLPSGYLLRTGGKDPVRELRRFRVAIRRQQHLAARFDAFAGAVVGQGQERQWGFYPMLSLVSHSCSPSARVTLDPRGIPLLRIPFGAEQGREVTIDYLGSEGAFMSREERAAALFQRYGIVCTCAKCCNGSAWDEVYACRACAERGEHGGIVPRAWQSASKSALPGLEGELEPCWKCGAEASGAEAALIRQTRARWGLPSLRGVGRSRRGRRDAGRRRRIAEVPQGTSPCVFKAAALGRGGELAWPGPLTGGHALVGKMAARDLASVRRSVALTTEELVEWDSLLGAAASHSTFYLNPDFSDLLETLSVALYSRGEKKRAFALLATVVSSRVTMLGRGHPSTARAEQSMLAVLGEDCPSPFEEMRNAVMSRIEKHSAHRLEQKSNPPGRAATEGSEEEAARPALEADRRGCGH